MDRTRTARLERKDAAVAAAGPLLEEPQGIVQAIVSVTGVADGDGDIIEPGAYTKTLATRKPKVVWHHDWKTPVGRVLEIEELMPGDPRLPKTTRDGRPWPAQAGALVVTKQYNLRSEQGREAFEAVRFFSETGEAEYSIGYVVPQGKARRGKDGVRRIKELELFEISPVLFGANSLSGTLSVKSAKPTARTAGPSGPAPAGDPWGDPWEENAPQADAQDDPWADLFGEQEPPRPAARANARPDTRGRAAQPAGGPPQERPRRAAVQGKSGAPGVADTPEDARSVQRLKNWYRTNPDIGWGTPGDFDRCMHIAGKHMPPGQAKGFCSNIHHDVTREWPGRGAHGGRGRKCFDAGGKHGSIHPSGSWEERRDLLLDAVRDFMLDSPGQEPDSMPGVPGVAGQGGVGAMDPAEAMYPPDDTLVEPAARWVTVDINGTWEDRVIVTRYGIAPAGAAPLVESYEIPYVIDDDGEVELGDPQPVKLTVTPIPTELPDLDGDEDDGGGMSPVPGMVEEAAAAAKALYLLRPAVEGKAGRVLSGMNARRLRAAVQQLLAVLAAAGVNITSPAGPSDDEPDEDDVEQSEPGADVALAISDQQDSTAPGARPARGKSAPAPTAAKSGRPGRVTLSGDPLTYVRELRKLAGTD